MLDYHLNKDVLHVNTQPNRAYYMPFSDENTALNGNRENSAQFISLNGIWNFKYYPNQTLLEQDFECGNIAGTKPIPVPSVWQMHGFDRHQYTNTRFPFPFDPPFVPFENPCGLYVRDFDITETDTLKYLNFEGVDCCHYVWINGEFVGYSEVSHMTSEFDITKLVKLGMNRVAVLVFKWGVPSYFEDQDKLRMSGIFRDVYILARPAGHINNYRVKTAIEGSSARVTVTVDHECDYTFENTNGTSVNGKIEITVDNPILWNAENPHLYTLILRCAGEIIVEKVGIREVRIENAVLLLNGEKIKFRGVNRHDSDSETGPVISIAQMEKDFALMKQHNINAIRTSHYPNAPYFYQLCDKYGFYVIDEADIETHGCNDVYDPSRNSGNMSTLSNDPQFSHIFIDRVQMMIHRDINRPCVLLWSLGNESGYGVGYEKALEWIKSFDNTRLTHYESSVWFPKCDGYTPDFSNLDVYSRMYPSTDEMNEFLTNGIRLNDEIQHKPYVLCEYCHAMGNGPGDFEDYYEVFRKYDQACGGFVWEWCDHSVYMGITDAGKKKYYYGGDFGEFPHDSNFCMDGLVYPDRTPHNGLLEYKNVNRPLRLIAVDNNKITLENTLDFTNIADYLSARFEIVCDKTTLASGELPTLNILPHQQSTIELPLEMPTQDNCYLNIFYYQNHDRHFTRKGHLLGFDQHKITASSPPPRPAAHGDIDFVEDACTIKIFNDKFNYVFDKNVGTFTKLSVQNVDILHKPLEYNIWRAPTDNDRNIVNDWRKAGYDRAYSKTYSCRVEKDAKRVIIDADMAIVATYLQPILKFNTKLIIDANGGIEFSHKVEQDERMPFLPRFGLRMFVDKSYNKVGYFGYGPHESYIDKRRSSYKGHFTGIVSDFHEDYCKPQENGAHFDCQYMDISGDNTLKFSGESFSFNVSCYTQEELAKKAHNFELEKANVEKLCYPIMGHEPNFDHVICVDYAHSGIGSNSCGPGLLNQYKIPKQFEFSFYFLVDTHE